MVGERAPVGMDNRQCLQFVALCAVVGCGGTGALPDAGQGTQAADAAMATCDPPDVLAVLDRTASMAERPDGMYPANTPAGHAESKWYTAINAVESVTTRLDTTIRFGLELFPR